MIPLRSALLVALLVAGAPVDAWAHEPTATSAVERTGWGLHSAVSASIDNGAFAAALGARYALADAWLLGLDAEYNPWFSFEAGRFAEGAFNAYVTAIHRYRVNETLDLRVTAHVGASVLLFDLVGAPAGSVGPLVGGSLLGLAVEAGDGVYLLFDPAQVILPVPQVRGAPFSYHQYRLTVGVQWGG